MAKNIMTCNYLIIIITFEIKDKAKIKHQNKRKQVEI